MPNIPGEGLTSAKGDSCLDISLQSLDSSLRTHDGREIPFTRVILTVRNVCDSEVASVELHATLGQESGTVQDVTSAFSQTDLSSIPSGEAANWDVYDLLIPAHPGAASKIHMFGYRAALNWRFDLVAWAEYRPSGFSTSVQTPISRWAFRWSVPDPVTGKVELTIEDMEGGV